MASVRSDQFIVFQLCISSVLCLMQLSIMPVFVLYGDLRRRILYRVQLSITLSDSLQLYAIWQFTLFEFLGVQWSPTIEKFASGIYIIAWDHLIIQHFLLALNRLLIILRVCYSPNSACKNRDSRNECLLFDGMLVFSWAVLLILQALFMTPFCGGFWNRDAVGFFYDERPVTLKCSEIYSHIELYFTIVFPVVSCGFYITIVVLLRRFRNAKVQQNIVVATQPAVIAQNQNDGVKLSNQEKRILVLSVVLFSIITVLIWAWYIDYTRPPWTMLFCGYLLLNSSLSLAMNSEFRQRYLHMWMSVYSAFWCKKLAPNWQTMTTRLAAETNKNNNNNGALFIRVDVTNRTNVNNTTPNSHQFCP